jgi:hypothetical protein
MPSAAGAVTAPGIAEEPEHLLLGAARPIPVHDGRDGRGLVPRIEDAEDAGVEVAILGRVSDFVDQLAGARLADATAT